jgi:hypothetical protein
MPRESAYARAAFSAGHKIGLIPLFDVGEEESNKARVTIQIAGPDGIPIQDGTRFIFYLFFSDEYRGGMKAASLFAVYSAPNYGQILSQVVTGGRLFLMQTDEYGKADLEIEYGGAVSYYPNVEIGGVVFPHHVPLVLT